MKICREPFENIEIDPRGNVYFCCACTLNHYSIGNIFETDFELIWNSEKARQFRQKLLENDYSYCDPDICYNLKYKKEPYFLEKNDYPNIFKEVPDFYPKRVKFMHDSECNVNCIICRDNIIRRTSKELDFLNSKISSVFLPLLKDAELVVLNPSGDCFGSRHNMELIKKISALYPKIKFEFHTNGILASKLLIEKYKLQDRIERILISIHAAKEDTYNKIVQNGNYNKLCKNLQYLSELKKENKIEELILNFVVTSINYEEMVDFLIQGIKLDALVFFWEYRMQGYSEKADYNKLSVHLPSHPEHNNLLKILQNPIFTSLPYNPLHPVLAGLREKAIKVID